MTTEKEPHWKSPEFRQGRFTTTSIERDKFKDQWGQPLTLDQVRGKVPRPPPPANKPVIKKT